MRLAVGPAAVDRFAEVATCVGMNDGVVTARAAYHSPSSHCGCEIVAEAQGCCPRAREDYEFDLEGTLGRSHCKHLEAVHTYPWVGVVVL